MSDEKYVCLIGAQKSGTTSLYKYLATHPAIHTVRWKESKYFLNDVPSADDQQRYERLLEGRQAEQYVFETSTYYTKFPECDGVPRRIHERHPDAKLIYLVRDPVERIWSQYSHYLAKDWERRPFSKAIRTNPVYLDVSRYYLQLSRYLDVFPREQILVLVFEEFIRDSGSALRQVFEFLEIDSEFQAPNLDVTYNSGSVKRGMSLTKRLLFAMPGYRRLPWRIRNWAKYLLGSQLPGKTVSFSDEDRGWLRSELADDLNSFVDFLGRDVPLWKCLNRQDSSNSQLSCPVEL